MKMTGNENEKIGASPLAEKKLLNEKHRHWRN